MSSLLTPRLGRNFSDLIPVFSRAVCSSCPSAELAKNSVKCPNFLKNSEKVEGGEEEKATFRTPEEAKKVSNLDNWLLRLSPTVPRSLLFDRLFSKSKNEAPPEEVLELDRMAMISLKMLDMPRVVKERITHLLREFGHKKALERYGRYMQKKMNARAAAEIPSTLPSLFVPEKAEDNDLTPIDKLINSKTYKQLREWAPSLLLQSSVNPGEEAPPDTALAEVARLALAQARDGKVTKLFQMQYPPEAAIAYTAEFYPESYAVCFRVLYEAARRSSPSWVPKSFLDYGAGPAPAVTAAVEIWGSKNLEKVVCVEPSLNMQKVGKYLTADIPKMQWIQQLYEEKAQKYDVVTASYVQMEIKGQPSRDLLVQNLWNRVSPEGILVLIERGTPTGFRFMHHLREMFISSLPPDAFHFVAPCPHESACPLALTGRDWCRFGLRFMKIPKLYYMKGNRQKQYESAEFSFLVIRKGKGPRQEFETEKDAPTPWQKSYFWPRLVLPAIKAGGHTLIDVCGAPNNFERLSTSRARPHAFGHKQSRKLMWGDLWRYPKRITRREARCYTPEQTKMYLERLAKKARMAIKMEAPPAQGEEKRRKGKGKGEKSGEGEVEDADAFVKEREIDEKNYGA